MFIVYPDTIRKGLYDTAPVKKNAVAFVDCDFVKYVILIIMEVFDPEYPKVCFQVFVILYIVFGSLNTAFHVKFTNVTV